MHCQFCTKCFSIPSKLCMARTMSKSCLTFTEMLYAILPLLYIFFPADYRLPCTNKLNIDFSYFSSLIFYLIKNALLTFSTLTPASGQLNILRFLITTYPTRLWEACIIKELYRELFLGTGLVEQQMCLPSLRHMKKRYTSTM